MASHTFTDIEATLPSNITENFRNIQQMNLRKLAKDAQIHIPKPTTIDLVGGIYCHLCELTYSKKKEYEDHYSKHGSGEKIVYTCVVCHKQHTSYPSLRGHCYTTHVIKCRHKCEYCLKYFSKITALNDHIKAMHTFKCSTCNKQFTSKSELQLHQIIHDNTGSVPYHCQVCEVKLASLDSCKDHADVHTVFIYTCPICNENIPSRDDAGLHLLKHFDDIKEEKTVEVIQNSDNQETSIERLGGIACGYCTVICKDRVEFDAHVSYEHGDKDIVYVCVVCDKLFEKYSAFGEHAYNHFSKDRYCCSICLKTFNRLSMLATHMAVCQADSESSGKPFACSECGHRYGTEQRLRKHLQDEHGIHCIRCPVENCQKICASPKELIFHQYVHNSQQNWCRQCGLLFTSLTSCERHIDVHRQKLYGCPICNRNYREKYVLMKHITQHFESTVHICKVCGKVYNHRRRFLEHVKTHNEKRTHTCTYCNKGFSKLDLLRQHLNVHTGSKPYKCTICSRTFASYPNWAKHKRRMHNLEGKIYKKYDPTSDDEAEEINEIKIDSKTSDEAIFTKNDGKIKINNSNLDTITNNESLIEINPQINVTDMKLKYQFQVQNSTLEPETIHCIDIEKELQIMQNIPVKPHDGNFELVDVLETNNAIFDNVSTAIPANAGPSSEASNYPPEYGPEFTIGDSCGILDLDDHMLPHIDPLLTIKTEEFNMTHKNTLLPPYLDPATYQKYQVTPKWEPPVFTKVFPEYPYYGDMVDANRLSMMNTDIF